MNTLLALAIAMFVGLLFTRLVKIVNLPNVTGFLVAGLLIGPSCLKLVGTMSLEQFKPIVTVTLGFIAFAIGSEFKISNVKQIGAKALSITFAQVIGAIIIVFFFLLAIGTPLPKCLVLASIATATAPAATIMVVRQYKADGIVTRTLLPVVAMNDAVGLVIFSIFVAIAQSIVHGTNAGISKMIFAPIIEVGGSLLLGSAIGVVVSIAMKFFKSRANRLSILIASVVLGTAFAQMWGISSLLICMMTGVVFANLSDEAEVVIEAVDRFTPPLFMLFFVISGAELDFSLVPTIGIIGIVYIIARTLGKYLGTFVGAHVAGSHKNIRNYLGIALMPQAGVAIGMVQMVAVRIPEFGEEIKAIILCATLVYEVLGPILIKWALIKAGEIVLPEKAPKEHKITQPEKQEA